jgi:SAM-dependent methyltransferase
MNGWEIAWALAVGTVALFCFVILFGAPFLPVLRPQLKTALDLVDLKPGQTMLELGSGDGRVLVAAAEKGWNVVGYELNPALALYSWLRTRKYRGRVTVVWGNYWRHKWPECDGIYTFLLQPYMKKLDTKITQEVGKPVKLVSIAFYVPDRTPARQENGVFLYLYT